MSRTSKRRSADPSEFNMQMNAKTGVFNVYNKETKQKTDLTYPFSFIVLDQAQQVTGYNQKLGASIGSNMSRGDAPGYFKVRLYGADHKDFPIEGFWKDIKDRVELYKGRWAKVIYALMEGKIVKITLTGSSSWAFSSLNDEYNGEVVVTGTKKEKNGDVEYHVPVFSSGEITEEEEALATEVTDKVIEPFLSAYFKEPEKDAISDAVEQEIKSGSTPNLEPKEDMEVEDELAAGPTDDLPFIVTILLAVGSLSQFLPF